MRLLSPINVEVETSDIGKALIYHRYGWTTDAAGKLTLMAVLAGREMGAFGVSAKRAGKQIAESMTKMSAFMGQRDWSDDE